MTACCRNFIAALTAVIIYSGAYTQELVYEKTVRSFANGFVDSLLYQVYVPWLPVSTNQEFGLTLIILSSGIYNGTRRIDQNDSPIWRAGSDNSHRRAAACRKLCCEVGCKGCRFWHLLMQTSGRKDEADEYNASVQVIYLGGRATFAYSPHRRANGSRGHYTQAAARRNPMPPINRKEVDVLVSMFFSSRFYGLEQTHMRTRYMAAQTQHGSRGHHIPSAGTLAEHPTGTTQRTTVQGRSSRRRTVMPPASTTHIRTREIVD